MKANDSIPRDEMLLAEALAAAKALKLKHCIGQPILYTYEGNMVACCAQGALQLAGINHLAEGLCDIWIGNDGTSEPYWGMGAADRGRSLGHAFFYAMTEAE